MARDDTPAFATVRDALDRRAVEELKKLLALLPATEKPTRKAEIAELVAAHLEGGKMSALWGRLDPTQRSAVAETLYAAERRFDGVRFAAKYGESPDWGTSRGLDYDRTPSPLQLFIQETVLETFPEDKLPQKVVRQVEWWDEATNKPVRETEDVPIVYRDTERIAAGELQAILRLVEAGKVAVSDTTRFPAAATLKAVAAVLDGGDYYAPEDVGGGIEPAGPIHPFAWPPAAPPSPPRKPPSARRCANSAISSRPCECLCLHPPCVLCHMMQPPSGVY